MAIWRRTLIMIVSLLILGSPLARAQATGTEGEGQLSSTLPLVASGLFIGLAVWVGIKSWKAPETKSLQPAWDGTKLPDDIGSGIHGRQP